MQLFPVQAKVHPLRTQSVRAMFPVGASIRDVVGPKADDTIGVTIEGEFIPRELWERIRPKAGTQIEIVRYPQGRTARKVVGVILLVVIAIFAPYLAPWLATTFGIGMTAATVLAVGITMLATMAAYALIPPPEMPKMASMDGGGESFSRLNAITGTSNQAMMYGTIPMVIGECRYYPPFAANPFTEISGDEQYLRMLLDCGYGDLEISDIKIGETPIDDFDGVDYEVSYSPDLFTDDVFELSLADAFNPTDEVLKTSQTNVNEMSVDIVFPGGLFGVNDKGKTVSGTTTFTLEYRVSGSLDPWSPVADLPLSSRTISSPSCSIVGGEFQVRSSARKALRIGIRWKVPTGQYDIRLVRGSSSFPGANSAAQYGDAQIAVFRSIRYTQASSTGTLKLALRIKATEQLNGVINQLSVVGQQKIRVYDSGTEAWLPPAVNYNPAWVYHWLLTSCDGVAKLVTDDRIDLPAFIDWADECTAKGFTCKGMIDRSMSHGDLIKMVLSAGRASFAMKDGKYSVLYDKDGLVPVQHFTPANSKNFKGQRVFIDLPHALRVRFQNPALNWQEDEIIVLDDEHSFNGLDAHGNASALPEATKFETLTLPFVTEPDSAWMLARYHMAQGIYRANIYTWDADVEHLICTRGDLVYVAHDVTDWGSGFGLISDVVRDGSNQVTQIITAEPLMVESGETYSIRVRTREGNSYISTITGLVADTEATEFTLATPMAEDVDVGDMYMLGKTTSAIRQLLVTRIEPSTDFNATLQAVEYNAAVQTFDDDPPATFVSAITGTLILEPPPPPNIYAVFSDEYAGDPNDDGGFEPGINLGIDPGPSGFRNPFNPKVPGNYV